MVLNDSAVPSNVAGFNTTRTEGGCQQVDPNGCHTCTVYLDSDFTAVSMPSLSITGPIHPVLAQ